MRDNADNRLRLRTHRWYDPHHELFDGDGSRYAEGPFYVIEGHLIDGIVRSGLTLRMGGPNEGEVLPTLHHSETLHASHGHVYGRCQKDTRAWQVCCSSCVEKLIIERTSFVWQI